MTEISRSVVQQNLDLAHKHLKEAPYNEQQLRVARNYLDEAIRVARALEAYEEKL